jgi:cyclophilin family peptidyl-prolyl cis-trans isomerase
MKHSFTALVLAALLASMGAHAGEGTPSYVRIQTSQGDILIELDSASAPRSVENFLTYVREGGYNGTIFHRVVGDFLVQGGCFTPDFEQRPTHGPIPTEATNGLLNKRGTIAMARNKDQDSATNQFFINLSDNLHLNHHAPAPGYWGYTVFGKVVQGMDVVDRIGQSATGEGGPFPQDVPQSPILITHAELASPSEFMTAQIETEDASTGTTHSKRNTDTKTNKNK